MTGLLARSGKGIVPKAATQAELLIKSVRLDGGYADNLSLVIAKK